MYLYLMQEKPGGMATMFDLTRIFWIEAKSLEFPGAIWAILCPLRVDSCLNTLPSFEDIKSLEDPSSPVRIFDSTGVQQLR